jgi:hypothetical protein
MQRDEQTDMDRLLIHDEMFKQGIVPIETVRHDMRRCFEGMNADEARIAKRKFRKMWRTAARKAIAKANKHAAPKLAKDFGLGEKLPTKSNCYKRKAVVFSEIWETLIVPKLEIIEATNK